MEHGYLPYDWETPDFSSKRTAHDWKTYATPEIIAIWGTFSGEQKRVIVKMLDKFAEGENWE